MKIRVTKCYLVQVLDDEGNELSCTYDFVNNKEEAVSTGKKMVEAIERDIQNDDSGES